MTASRELDVTVVYSEGGVVSPAVKRRTAPPRVDRRRLLGCLTLLMAASWMYVTWFPVRHFLGGAYLKAMTNLPGLVDWSHVLGFKPPPPNLANPAPPKSARSDEPIGKVEEPAPVSAYRSDATPPPASADQRARSQAILARLGIAKYTWLTVMTIVGCWLAMTGAAGVGGWRVSPGQARSTQLFAIVMLVFVTLITIWYWPRAGAELARIPRGVQIAYAAAFALLAGSVCASSSRGKAARLFVIGLVVLGVLTTLAWHKYEGGFPIRATQACVFCLMIVVALLGAALSSHVRGLTSVAIVLVLLSCVATVIGMLYGQRNGGFVTYTPMKATCVAVIAVVIQSSFAGVLLGAKRLAR